MAETRDHGGNLDAAMARWGGTRDGWLDLSTGINPVPYPVPPLPDPVWSALPDRAAQTALADAARAFWNIPDRACVIAAPGASALIAALPGMRPAGAVHIPGPTYNEHRAAFLAHSHTIGDESAPVHVHVHPNNPDGRLLRHRPDADLTVIDESFCDVMPQASHVGDTAHPGIIVLKSFGKFWGLAGLRLGFAIGHPDTLAGLRDRLGPWAVSGPGLLIGTAALRDSNWANTTRTRLDRDAKRLDSCMAKTGATCLGGTDLFRLYDTDDAALWQKRLARHHVLSRIFPYSHHWLRLGLPHPDRFAQLEHALRDGGRGDGEAERRKPA